MIRVEDVKSSKIISRNAKRDIEIITTPFSTITNRNVIFFERTLEKKHEKNLRNENRQMSVIILAKKSRFKYHGKF